MKLLKEKNLNDWRMRGVDKTNLGLIGKRNKVKRIKNLHFNESCQLIM